MNCKCGKPAKVEFKDSWRCDGCAYFFRRIALSAAYEIKRPSMEVAEFAQFVDTVIRKAMEPTTRLLTEMQADIQFKEQAEVSELERLYRLE